MSRDIRIVFGESVKKMRLSKKMTQEEAAHMAGLHSTYWGQVERGVRNPSLINIYKIAKVLRVPISKIFPD